MEVGVVIDGNVEFFHQVTAGVVGVGDGFVGEDGAVEARYDGADNVAGFHRPVDDDTLAGEKGGLGEVRAGGPGEGRQIPAEETVGGGGRAVGHAGSGDAQGVLDDFDAVSGGAGGHAGGVVIDGGSQAGSHVGEAVAGLDEVGTVLPVDSGRDDVEGGHGDIREHGDAQAVQEEVYPADGTLGGCAQAGDRDRHAAGYRLAVRQSVHRHQRAARIRLAEGVADKDALVWSLDRHGESFAHAEAARVPVMEAGLGKLVGVVTGFDDRAVGAGAADADPFQAGGRGPPGVVEEIPAVGCEQIRECARKEDIVVEVLGLGASEHVTDDVVLPLDVPGGQVLTAARDGEETHRIHCAFELVPADVAVVVRGAQVVGGSRGAGSVCRGGAIHGAAGLVQVPGGEHGADIEGAVAGGSGMGESLFGFIIAAQRRRGQ